MTSSSVLKKGDRKMSTFLRLRGPIIILTIASLVIREDDDFSRPE